MFRPGNRNGAARRERKQDRGACSKRGWGCAPAGLWLGAIITPSNWRALQGEWGGVLFYERGQWEWHLGQVDSRQMLRVVEVHQREPAHAPLRAHPAKHVIGQPPLGAPAVAHRVEAGRKAEGALQPATRRRLAPPGAPRAVQDGESHGRGRHASPCVPVGPPGVRLPVARATQPTGGRGAGLAGGGGGG
eukprot:scaffold9850_cov93-Isochrysis_galbana.AAC.1